MPSSADRADRLVTRDLTQCYARARRERRKMQKQQQHHQPKHHRPIPSGAEALISPDRGPTSPTSSRGGEGPSLPPQWVDFADKAHEEMREIRSQLVQLTKAQERRLLNLKAGDRPDKDIQDLSSSIGTLIRCCEQSIHQVRTCGGRANAALMDDAFRQNVQRSLAAQLQQLSRQCREAQKEYLRRRQAGADLERGTPSNTGNAGSDDATRSALGPVQMQGLDEMEEIAATRSTEITQIAASVSELHQIFKDLASLVIDQGTVLDRIDYNTEKIYKKSDDAKGQMQKAVKRKKSGDSRVMKCFVFWVAADLMLFLVLLVKYQLKYGLVNVFWFLCISAMLIGACVLFVKWRRPELLSAGHWLKLCPDLDPKALWRRLRPGPLNAAKAAGAAVRAGNLGTGL